MSQLSALPGNSVHAIAETKGGTDGSKNEEKE